MPAPENPAAADAPHREGRPGHRGRRPQPAAEGRALSPQDRDDQGRRARPLARAAAERQGQAPGVHQQRPAGDRRPVRWSRRSSSAASRSWSCRGWTKRSSCAGATRRSWAARWRSTSVSSTRTTTLGGNRLGSLRSFPNADSPWAQPQLSIALAGSDASTAHTRAAGRTVWVAHAGSDANTGQARVFGGTKESHGAATYTARAVDACGARRAFFVAHAGSDANTGDARTATRTMVSSGAARDLARTVDTRATRGALRAALAFFSPDDLAVARERGGQATSVGLGRHAEGVGLQELER